MVATAYTARDLLIEKHLPFARNLAALMARRLPRHVDVEELECDAYLGLLKAAKGFDPRIGVRFTTYATPKINGAMLDGLRDRQHSRRRGQPHPTVLSLSTPAFDGDGRPLTLGDSISACSAPVGRRMELLDEARFAMRAWEPGLRRVMRERYLHGLNQRETAEKLGISASAVSLRLKLARGLATVSRSRGDDCG